MGDDGDGDCVDVASADSFPASDAPAWATGRGRGPRPGSGDTEHGEHGEGEAARRDPKHRTFGARAPKDI